MPLFLSSLGEGVSLWWLVFGKNQTGGLSKKVSWRPTKWNPTIEKSCRRCCNVITKSLERFLGQDHGVLVIGLRCAPKSTTGETRVKQSLLPNETPNLRGHFSTSQARLSTFSTTVRVLCSPTNNKPFL